MQPVKRELFRVTCKIAFFSPDRASVLLIEQQQGKYGLPGGHLEEGEAPEQGLLREVQEELGVVYKGILERRDFWTHADGKIVLGFVGELDQATEFMIDPQEVTATRWVSIEMLQSGEVSAGGYHEFILRQL